MSNEWCPWETALPDFTPTLLFGHRYARFPACTCIADGNGMNQPTGGDIARIARLAQALGFRSSIDRHRIVSAGGVVVVNAPSLPEGRDGHDFHRFS